MKITSGYVALWCFAFAVGLLAGIALRPDPLLMLLGAAVALALAAALSIYQK